VKAVGWNVPSWEAVKYASGSIKPEYASSSHRTSALRMMDHMEWFLLALLVIVVALVGWFFLTYNSLVTSRNRSENAWGQVDVQLQRRYDLIPNLVETVKGYASHEKETFERVIAARAQAQAASGPAEAAQADNILTGALRQLFALAEAYPELKASTNFSQLQDALSDTENKVSVSRQIYNDTVLTYNNRVQTVPSNIVANLANFKTREYFDAPEAADEAPKVEF
jgi:LemA protein